MEEIAAHKDSSTVLTDIPRYSAEPIRPEWALGAGAHIPATNLLLFFLTILTTTTAGAYMAGEDLSVLHPIAAVVSMRAGLSFSMPLMAILLAHEMGHYLTARYHGVPTSLPYFIPAPPIFITGTLGAFIRIKAMPRTRRVMFDIGAAGPWAGVVVAIPAVMVGLWLSNISPIDKSLGGLELGNSLLFLGLSRLVLGVDPAAVTVTLHPLAFAGWFGLFVTSINLLPVGQLDGGHVTYALFPRLHRTISTLFVVSCVLMVIVPLALGWELWWGWLLWAVLSVGLGLGHPATVDRDTPLNPRRALAAWLSVALFIVTFSPVPLSFVAPEPSQMQEPRGHTQEILDRTAQHSRIPRHDWAVRI
jgi:membrane-associated protease RseP (regulator of RpoE activity)